MVQSVIVLGSTGSIGVQTLAVCRALNIPVQALACHTSVELLAEQIRTFRPEAVCVGDGAAASRLRDLLAAVRPLPAIETGSDGLRRLAALPGDSMVVAALVGFAGLESVLAALDSGKDVALANKETLVAGGQLVMARARKNHCRIHPVDSEHSAIWQCLNGRPAAQVARIFLTASGGPFRTLPQAELSAVTVEDALRHPNWEMGRKISIDSATLMNKGLELIEACWLFDLEPDQIEVVVHPQSIIHSMVEFRDRSVLAQLGFPDMSLPIQLALTWPERVDNPNFAPFDPFDERAAHLTFERPDEVRFPALRLAREAIVTGGTLPAVLNAANEAAVHLFLARQIPFTAISELVEGAMIWHRSEGAFLTDFSFGDMMLLDRDARLWVQREANMRFSSSDLSTRSHREDQAFS